MIEFFFFFWVGSILNIYEYCQSMKKTRWHAEVKWGVIWVKLSSCMSWGKLNCFPCLFHAVETGISASNFWWSINFGPLVKELINLNGLSYIFIFGLENYVFCCPGIYVTYLLRENKFHVTFDNACSHFRWFVSREWKRKGQRRTRMGEDWKGTFQRLSWQKQRWKNGQSMFLYVS